MKVSDTRCLNIFIINEYDKWKTIADNPSFSALDSRKRKSRTDIAGDSLPLLVKMNLTSTKMASIVLMDESKKKEVFAANNDVAWVSLGH
jgi:hypothetical protein